jgi:hypothetical protein
MATDLTNPAIVSPTHAYAALRLLEAGKAHEAIVELRRAFGIGTDQIKHPDGRVLAEIIASIDLTNEQRAEVYRQAADIAKERLDWLRSQEARP